MRSALFLMVIAAGACRAPEDRRDPPARGAWVLAERPSSGSALALVRLPDSPARRAARAVVEAPESARVAEVFEVRVRVPGAVSGEARRFRLIPGRPGLRFPDGDEITVVGSGPASARVVADSAGPAGIRATEVR